MKYFDTKKDSLEEAISKAINEKPEQLKEARYEIGFERGEVDMVISDRPGELAMIVQDELDSERIRAKVKSTGDEFKLEFTVI